MASYIIQINYIQLADFSDLYVYFTIIRLF